MSELGERMVDGDRQPDARSVAAWLGTDSYKRWTHLIEFIEGNYPGVFTPDWVFGGRKYGWGLRFKKSKSFCTLIPERGRLVVQIVFGGEEREKAEKILPELSPGVRETYTNATTYHDGKWLGRRCKDKALIWILGGDRGIDNDIQRETIRAMAPGLRRGDGGAHLMVFHPPGGNGSSTVIGEFPNTGVREFLPPDKGGMLDWVLVLDDASKDYPAPGTH